LEVVLKLLVLPKRRMRGMPIDAGVTERLPQRDDQAPRHPDLEAYLFFRTGA
jgi:hypothetical protein